MSKTGIAGVLILTLTLSFLLSACSPDPQISFAADVRPIIDQYCLECHQAGGEGFEASGLDMISYEGLMKGTEAGPMVIAGDVEGSNILVLMEGRADPSITMPHNSLEPVPGKQIDVIRAWIDQGAKNN